MSNRGSSWDSYEEFRKAHEDMIWDKYVADRLPAGGIFPDRAEMILPHPPEQALSLPSKGPRPVVDIQIDRTDESPGKIIERSARVAKDRDVDVKVNVTECLGNSDAYWKGVQDENDRMMEILEAVRKAGPQIPKYTDYPAFENDGPEILDPSDWHGENRQVCRDAPSGEGPSPYLFAFMVIVFVAIWVFNFKYPETAEKVNEIAQDFFDTWIFFRPDRP